MEEQNDTLGNTQFSKQNSLQRFKLTDSYVSLILGVIVVIAALILAVSFIRNKPSPTKEISSTSTQLSEVVDQIQKGAQKKDEQKKYSVVAGDTLWGIAESSYGTGFEWKTIADANKIVNPESLEVGTILVIPQVSSSSVIQESVAQDIKSITASSYTVEQDDNLWLIAVRAYGDGFKWVDIMRENNLVNPSLIHKGNTFKIPR
ncbi:MAG: hypothetical protein A2698_01805 [Candidatus Levybacteria bacterium RIFCSPHIGHO2_01_FULL_42_15]|nr:MAG: hypothetical protein A2698_01805 [Candidatus Levybacteria bacterium RIFCSPHIGHO2_01_FULL_42_15]OGH42651.1 MAG: hypothetical protein A3B53_02580 [Candidatus Levybacteria bacterium RIFCSPLOWO2_01_FULL_42_15]